jgi:hypothetical protein
MRITLRRISRCFYDERHRQITQIDPGWLALPAAFRATRTQDGREIARTRMSGLIGGHDMSHQKRDLALPPSSASCGPLGWAAMLPAWQARNESEARLAQRPIRAQAGVAQGSLFMQGLRRLARPAAATQRLLFALFGWTLRHNLAQTGAAGRAGLSTAATTTAPIAAPQRLDHAPPRRKEAA